MPKSAQSKLEERSEAGRCCRSWTDQTAAGGDRSRAGCGADEGQEGAGPALAALPGAGAADSCCCFVWKVLLSAFMHIWGLMILVALLLGSQTDACIWYEEMSSETGRLVSKSKQ